MTADSVPAFAGVYIIYSADVISPRTSDITGMAPARHVPASIGGAEPEAAERIAAAFTETEDDDEYEFGYLGKESGDVRYFPYGFSDSEGWERPYLVRVKCLDGDGDELLPVSAPTEEVAMEHYADEGREVIDAMLNEDEPVGMGQHRKWVGELSIEDWRVFARAYNIDLLDNDLPEDYSETKGSLTEHGHLPAISVDNSEGWDYPGFGYGSVECVLSSDMYVSFLLAPTTELESDRETAQ